MRHVPRHQPVTCRICGRTNLRGWKLPNTQHCMIQFHYQTDGSPCNGHDLDVHRPEAQVVA